VAINWIAAGDTMFCFTIRDMLWLTALVAMGSSWWLDHSRQTSRQLEAARIHQHDVREFRGQIDALKEQNMALSQHLRALDDQRQPQEGPFPFGTGLGGGPMPGKK
jgi:hypothetical protein